MDETRSDYIKRYEETITDCIKELKWDKKKVQDTLDKAGITEITAESFFKK